MREQRVAESIKEYLSDIIKNQVKDPRVGFSSITSVEVTNDLRIAKVNISVMGDPEQKQQTMKAIESAAGFIRSQLASKLSMRYVPELVFRLDSSIDHGLRIAQLLTEIKSEGSGDNSDGNAK